MLFCCRQVAVSGTTSPDKSAVVPTQSQRHLILQFAACIESSYARAE